MNADPGEEHVVAAGALHDSERTAVVAALDALVADAQRLRDKVVKSDVRSQSAIEAATRGLEELFARSRRLLLWMCGGSFLLVLGLLGWSWPNPGLPSAVGLTRLLLLSAGAGVLGSAVAALQSLLDRHANGFELSDGRKEPAGGKADRFSERMDPWFTARPALGGFAGLAVFAGSTFFGTYPGDLLGVTFFALLAGLFAKTLITRLKGIFSTMLGG